MSYPPDNPKMAYSRLAGLKPDRLKGMLYGVQGAQDESVKGIKSHRGDTAVAQLVSEIERYKALANQ